MSAQIRKVFDKSISLKIIFSLGLTIAIILSLFIYLLFQIQKREILKRTESYNYIISRLIYQHIENAMLAGKKEAIEDVLIDLVKSPEVLEANILDEKGVVKFSSKTEGLNISEGFSIVTPIKNKEACQKCHGKGETIGILQLKVSSSSMQKDLAKNRNLMLIFGLTILAGISTVITILTMKLLNKPLIHLMNAMDKVGKGDLSARADITRDDEIGRLGKHFNSMIVSLEDTKMELEEYRQRQLKELLL
jgi:methyl-accepting chemotaxis protein